MAKCNMSIIFCHREYSYSSCLFFHASLQLCWLAYLFLFQSLSNIQGGSHCYQIQYIVSSTDKWSNVFCSGLKMKKCHDNSIQWISLLLVLNHNPYSNAWSIPIPSLFLTLPLFLLGIMGATHDGCCHV